MDLASLVREGAPNSSSSLTRSSFNHDRRTSAKLPVCSLQPLQSITLKLTNLMKDYDLSNMLVYKNLLHVCVRVVTRAIELRDHYYETLFQKVPAPSPSKAKLKSKKSSSSSSSSSSSFTATNASSSTKMIRETTIPSLSTLGISLLQAALKQNGYNIYTSLERRIDEEEERNQQKNEQNNAIEDSSTANTNYMLVHNSDTFINQMIDIFRNIICSTGQVEQHSIFIALGTTTDALKNEFKHQTHIASLVGKARKMKPVPHPSTHRTIIDTIDILTMIVSKAINYKKLFDIIYILANSKFEKKEKLIQTNNEYQSILQDISQPLPSDWELDMAKFIRSNIVETLARK